MKHIKHWLMTAAMLLCSVAASAETVEIDGIWYNLVSKTKQAAVISNPNGKKYSSFITIPSCITYGDLEYCVTSIGSAFSGCTNLVSVTLPESVTLIGDFAFSGCTSLRSLTLPNGITSIGERAFYNCKALAFFNLCEGLTSIGVEAFYGSYIQVVTIPVGLTSIGERAFYGCGNLQKVIINEGVVSIPNSAFYGCTYLQEITLPESLTEIGEDAFKECKNLTKVNISNIAAWCEITFKSSCSSPLHYASFYSQKDCNLYLNGELVTNLVIPEGVTKINRLAFSGCGNLESITIPKSLTNIEFNAFDCRFSSVYISSVESWCNISFGDNPLGNFLYLNGELVTNLAIPEGITKISESAFSHCGSLKNIILPRGLMSIESDAFSYCTNLQSVNLPEGLTSIGSYAFNACSSLESITLPSSVTEIGNNAFYGCSSLESITIPEGVTEIGNNAFYDCSSLESITIPEGVTSIGDEAFEGCSSLTAITISEGVTSIGEYAFYNCSSLTTIVLPKNLKNIYSRAFANCSELLDVYCNAESVPNTYANAFVGSLPEYATLHVPACALESYKATEPWSSFGTIVPLTEEKVTSITLSQSTATLTEEQTLKLTAIVEPGYATNKAITWSSSDEAVATVDDEGKVSAVAPGTATITATANDGSGVSASCEVTVEQITVVNIIINQYGSGTYCSEYALDFSGVNGLKAYAATGYNSGTGVVTLTRVMTAKAGEGLFIKGEPGDYVVPMMENTDDNTLNMLVGTLEQTELNSLSSEGLYANYKYTVVEGEKEPLFHPFADGSTLSAGKAYLQIPVAWLPQGEARAISYRFDEGTTSIDEEQLPNDNDLPAEIYDLMGSRVAVPQKGSLYIINNEKVIY